MKKDMYEYLKEQNYDDKTIERIFKIVRTISNIIVSVAYISPFVVAIQALHSDIPVVVKVIAIGFAMIHAQILRNKFGGAR